MSKMFKPIALSAGGMDSELAAHGLGMEHVNELMARVARQLLQDGHRLAFGGTLGVPDEELTTLLIDAALGWLGENAAPVCVTQPSSWPLVNYTGWPHYTLISPAQKAELVGVCDFVEVLPPGIQADQLAPLCADEEIEAERLKRWRTDLTTRRYIAQALTHMRERLTQCAALRIVWGGRIRGAAGWMAGIAEEVLFSLRLEQPVLILGGFGGCAKILADFLETLAAPWPCELTLESACADKAYEALIKDSTHRAQLAARYDELQQSLMALRTRLHAGQDIFGVPAHLFFQVLSDESPRRAIRVAREVANLLKPA